jgi:hypothetical protein
MHQICHTWIHPHHHHSPLVPPLPFPGRVSTSIICTLHTYLPIFLHNIHHPTCSSDHLTPPTGTKLPWEWHFCLFEIKVITQGVSLW